MTKEELIKNLEDEKEYCEEQSRIASRYGQDAVAILWNGKYSGLKLALEYVYQLEED